MAAPSVAAPPSNGGLKKLGFVPEAGARGCEIASNIYSTAKGYVPASLQPRLDNLEVSVTNASAPYIAKAQGKGAELLKLADDQVDRAVGQASAVYANNTAYLQAQLDKQKAYHAQNVESYKAAREHYLKVVEQSVDYLKANGLSGTARKAADEVSTRVGEAKALPSYVLKSVQEAVDRLLALGPVHKAVDGMRPRLDAAYGAYASLHDRVVRHPQYARAYAAGQSALAAAQNSALYVKGRESIAPYVATYAQPALARVEPLAHRVAQHLTPKVAA